MVLQNSTTGESANGLRKGNKPTVHELGAFSEQFLFLFRWVLLKASLEHTPVSLLVGQSVKLILLRFPMCRCLTLRASIKELFEAICSCSFFIGPRCPWGPIYGSGCLKQTDSNTLCRLNWYDSGWWRYKLNTNWKCQWGIPKQCDKWHNLVANFGTKQCKWRDLMAKFWIDLQQIRKCIFNRNTNWF